MKHGDYKLKTLKGNNTMQAQLIQSYTPIRPIDKARQLDPKTREKMYAYQLEMRLQEWGVWYSKSLDNGTGYSNRSITVAALEFSRSTAPYYPSDNASAEEVHKHFYNFDIFIQIGRPCYKRNMCVTN
jgi:hypothetical protein